MKANKLGWAITITTFLGLTLIQTFTFMCEGELSFLLSLGLAICMEWGVAVILFLALLAIERIIDRIIS